MTERINHLRFELPDRSSTLEPFESNLFITQPHEWLLYALRNLLTHDERWSVYFGDNIDDYCRMDYSMRSLPAMRIYIERWRKEFESWWQNGEVKIDIIYPPSLRREQLQQVPQTLAGAVMQQLRSPVFFQSLCDSCPGLNEFGKTVATDLTMGFQYKDEIVPLTQITANFRIDLREWDYYLESDDRTKDKPFARTLGTLRSIVTTIQALRTNDLDSIELTLGIDQDV